MNHSIKKPGIGDVRLETSGVGESIDDSENCPFSSQVIFEVETSWIEEECEDGEDAVCLVMKILLRYGEILSSCGWKTVPTGNTEFLLTDYAETSM
jgi:hypothetical protein